LRLFESSKPADSRPRAAIEQALAWVRGEIPMFQARAAGEIAGLLECRWQRAQLPDEIRELVLDDQRLRNKICWSVFDG
jgi:hypothetical protein